MFVVFLVIMIVGVFVVLEGVECMIEVLIIFKFFIFFILKI